MGHGALLIVCAVGLLDTDPLQPEALLQAYALGGDARHTHNVSECLESAVKKRASLPRAMSGILIGTCVVSGLACSKKEPVAEPITLNIYNWAEYIAPSVIERFEKENNLKIVYDTYDSNETLLAKLQAGATGYDVVFPSDYMVTILVKNNLLQPLDKSKLGNMVNIDPLLLNQKFDPNNQYSIPYLWGTTGIGVRTDLVTTPVESWMDLFKPAAAIQGKISMLNDRKDLIGTALKGLGYSLNSVDPKQLDEVKALLLAQKPFVKVYDSSSYKVNFASGEVAIGQAWNGDIAALSHTGTANLKYVIPKEGSAIYCENMTVPKGATHLELAHKFINFLMQPEIAAEITNVTYYATPNRAALPFVREELRNDPTIFPSEEAKARLEFYTDIGEGSRLHEAVFEALKTE